MFEITICSYKYDNQGRIWQILWVIGQYLKYFNGKQASYKTGMSSEKKIRRERESSLTNYWYPERERVHYCAVDYRIIGIRDEMKTELSHCVCEANITKLNAFNFGVSVNSFILILK